MRQASYLSCVKQDAQFSLQVPEERYYVFFLFYIPVQSIIHLVPGRLNRQLVYMFYYHVYRGSGIIIL